MCLRVCCTQAVPDMLTPHKSCVVLEVWLETHNLIGDTGILTPCPSQIRILYPSLCSPWGHDLEYTCKVSAALQLIDVNTLFQTQNMLVIEKAGPGPYKCD
uniref:Uncharacterized protein n=1 Tax=Micrurus lemniscatus lemniscatus TaxID=129467 RepID=A0A2D4IVZ3_MICLE